MFKKKDPKKVKLVKEAIIFIDYTVFGHLGTNNKQEHSKSHLKYGVSISVLFIHT